MLVFHNRPSAALIIPGNQVKIDFCSVSDYNEIKKIENRWGFRANIKGYVTPAELDCTWLTDFEKQVGYLGALCASKLISFDKPTQSECEFAHILRSQLFRNGISQHYLTNDDGILKYKPESMKSPSDVFLMRLLNESEAKDDGMAEDGPHLLVDWLRRQRGGIEQLKSFAFSTSTSDIWKGWISGIQKTFQIQTRDEFDIDIVKYLYFIFLYQCVR